MPMISTKLVSLNKQMKLLTIPEMTIFSGIVGARPRLLEDVRVVVLPQAACNRSRKAKSSGFDDGHRFGQHLDLVLGPLPAVTGPDA